MNTDIAQINQLESFGTVDGPGIRFVVFFQGCPMRCQFCHNPDTWQVGQGAQYQFTPQELLEEVLRYKSFIRTGGVTASGGEPLVQAAFLREFFRLCREAGIHTCLDTSGAIWNEQARSVMDYTDLVMLDIKTLERELHKSYTGMSQDNNQRWMDYLQQLNKPTWIRHVIVPTITDDDTRLAELAHYIARYPCVERVELLGYHIMGEAKYQKMGIPYPLAGIPPLQAERLQQVREMFRQILPIKVL